MSTTPTPPLFDDLLPPPQLHALTLTWLQEDTPAFDPAGYLIGTTPTTAHLLLKSPATLAGRPFVASILSHHLSCAIRWQPGTHDGTTHIPPPNAPALQLATITGPARNLLLAERVVLNAYAECSAVATIARKVAHIARVKQWKGVVAGTRKTTPGFRLVQKYGMLVGGMDTHRINLSGMVMLKDNHVSLYNGIANAVRAVKAAVGFSVKIDVECADVLQAMEAAGAGADVVMLDNFAPARFVDAARQVKARFPGVLVEGSGGITLKTVAQYMCPHADVLSFSVNRYVTPVDMSIKVVKDEQRARGDGDTLLERYAW